MRAKSSLVSVALGVVLALVLAACGGGGSSSGSGGNGSSLPACPTGAIAKASKPVQITLWHSMPRANEQTLQKLTDQFNSSQSDVRVKLVNQTTYADTLTKYKAGLSSGDLPDLVQIEDTGLQQMIDTGSILPAQSCVNAEHYDTSDFVQRVLSYYTVKDVLWPMPFNVSNPVLYYNKNAFQQAGLDPDTPPSTLQEVKADAQKIVASGVTKGGFIFKMDPWYLEQWLAKAGEPYVNNGNGRQARATKVEFDSPAGREIFSWLSDMVHSKLASAVSSTAFDNLLAIGNKNAAMTIDTSAALGTISQVLASGQFADVRLGVGPMPGPVGKGGVLVGGAGLYIVKRSSPAKQEAAWRFAKFLDTPQSQATWAAGTGYVPIRKSAVDLPVLQQRWASEPFYKIAYDQLVTGVENTATAGPVFGAYQAVRDDVVNAMQSMFTQGTPPDRALQQAAKSADQAITGYDQRIGVG